MSNGRWKKGQSGNPKGRMRRQDAQRLELQKRLDSWINAATGLGSITQDKRTASQFIGDLITDLDARQLWTGNDIAARIIELKPFEALRAGWDVKIKEADDDPDEAEAGDVLELSEEVKDAADDLELDLTLEKAMQYENAYGGAAILPILNDGQKDWSLPLNEDNIMSLSHFMVLEPRELQARTWYSDVTKPKFGLPESYWLRPVTQGGVVVAGMQPVHESRLVIWPGIRVSRQAINVGRDIDTGTLNGASAQYPGWGTSLLSRVNTTLRDFGVAWESVGVLLQEMCQSVFKINGFAEMVAQNDPQGLQNLFLQMSMARSVLGDMVIDAKDEWDRKGLPLQNIPELLDKFSARMAAAADMPVTLLMGVSPAGLNATGESDRAFFYDRVQRFQHVKLRPRMEQLLSLIFRAKKLGADGEPGFGKEPDVWAVEFRPLWEPTAKEQAEIRWLNAQADGLYMDHGAVLPVEVALSRWGGGVYSDRMQIETKNRKALLDIESSMALEQAKNPEPAPQETPGGANPGGKESKPPVEANPPAGRGSPKQKQDTDISMSGMAADQVPVDPKRNLAGIHSAQSLAHDMEQREDRIKEEGGEWFVYSEDGSKRLSKGFASKGQALARLKEIEYYKNR